MTQERMVALLLAFIVALALLRLVFKPASGSLQRRVLLVLLGMMSAVFLYFTVLPPPVLVPAEQRIVLTAQADSIAMQPKGIVLALPEAAGARASSAQRIPDIATVRRQQPDITRLHIVGDGLPARDRDSVRGLNLRFTASPTPPGLVEFWQSETITLGAPWSVRGRVHGQSKATVEWLDPSGTVQERVRLPQSGEFAFTQVARAPGRVLYQMRVRAANGSELETFPIPVWVQPARALRVQSVAGAPNAELKTLRRWILDSGQSIRSRIDLAPSFALESERVDLSAAGLRGTDVLVLDERAWQSLNASERRQIRTAVSAGLGLILRVTGPLSSDARADFRQLGIQIDAVALPQSIKLDDSSEAIELNRQPVRVNAAQSRTMLHTAQGQALALAKAQGQGRVAVIWLSDSYRLALAGATARYGQIWSGLFSAVARPYERSGPTLPTGPQWQNQRLVICHLDEGAWVESDQERTSLLSEAIGPVPGCAGYWPQTAGWQTLQSGPHRLWFYVHPIKHGQSLQRQQTRLATQALVSSQSADVSSRKTPIPGSPWPWFWAWLAASGALWWLERRGMAKSQ